MSRYQDLLSRRALQYLLATQVLILIPLVTRLPIWLMLAAALVGFWRWRIHTGHWRFPGRWAKGALVLATVVGMALSYQAQFGMETMLSLLVAGFMLKLLELRRRPDLFVLCYLAYFVVGTQLLFASGIVGALYGLLCLGAVTATLCAANSAGGRTSVSVVLALVGQSLPVMLVLFFVIPRLGALWTVPMNQSGGLTGVSDSMAPGEMANLMRSSELAFRVTFEGTPPPPRQLYWRALVFEQFDGRTWETAGPNDIKRRMERGGDPAWQSRVTDRSDPVRYEVMLEPSGHNWLYALNAIDQYEPDSLEVASAGTLYRQRPVGQRLNYSVTSSLSHKHDLAGLSARQRERNTRLPPGYNPRTRELARQWRAEAESPQALIRRLLQHYRASFTYTLQPPTLGRHTVDEFLWQSQSGFCEHFAGSFVFFMRAAGIPARVVAGYQGGEANPGEGYFAIRQYDAHAWAEVWLDGSGWRRVDPTAAVAPERIENGVTQSLSDSDRALLGNAWARRVAFLNNLQLRWDALNYRWHRMVMGYDQSAQRAFIQRLFGDWPAWRIAVVVVVIVGAFLTALTLFGLWRRRRRPTHPAEQLFVRACQRMARRTGVARRRGEPPRHYLQRLQIEVGTDQARLVARFADLVALFEKACYDDNPRALLSLKRALSRLR